MNNLNKEEQEILQSVENNEWNSIGDFQDRKKIYQSYAQEYLNKSIEITLSTEDGQKLSQLADQLGKSPSSLTEEIIQKYLKGLLIDKTA